MTTFSSSDAQALYDSLTSGNQPEPSTIDKVVATLSKARSEPEFRTLRDTALERVSHKDYEPLLEASFRLQEQKRTEWEAAAERPAPSTPEQRKAADHQAQYDQVRAEGREPVWDVNAGRYR